jgi:hypothetical protein
MKKKKFGVLGLTLSGFCFFWVRDFRVRVFRVWGFRVWISMVSGLRVEVLGFQGFRARGWRPGLGRPA